MNTYILKINWVSEHKAKDLDHLRKWLVNLYSNDKVKVDVYIKTNTGERFIGIFSKYWGLPVWYNKSYTIVNDCRVIDKKTGKLFSEAESESMMEYARSR